MAEESSGGLEISRLISWKRWGGGRKPLGHGMMIWWRSPTLVEKVRCCDQVGVGRFLSVVPATNLRSLEVVVEMRGSGEKKYAAIDPG